MTSDPRQDPVQPPEIDRVLGHVSVLVVDDEPSMRAFVARALAPHCKTVESAADAATAGALINARHFDLVILDNVMPGQSGLDWLADQRRVGLFAEVIVISAYADLETAIHALRAGAADFLPKPFRAVQIVNAAMRCMTRRRGRYESHLAVRGGQAGSAASAQARLIGTSPEMTRVRQTLERAAGLRTPVLIEGESGTGKELAARSLHALSPRADKPFVPVTCASLSAERMADDLFGRAGEEGEGLLQRAAGGTLFLDDIADLPAAVQPLLLRVIETGSLRPPGSEQEIPLDLRFVLATGGDLGAAVAEGRLRLDLFHRISVLTVQMPPLRARRGDIGELAELFMGTAARQLAVPRLPLPPDVVARLSRHDWPGNVRELRNVIERALIMGEFSPEFAGGDVDTTPPPEALHEVERRHILAILEACGGNRAEAARRLGVSRKTIDRKCAMWKS